MINITINAYKYLLNIQIELEYILAQNYYNVILSLFLLFKILGATYYALKYFHKNHKYNGKKKWIN